ncbi:MAG: hypothetical protein EOO63_00720 [Hymenobacter sp.]|nr:MAG: hypothetical protein EOO63_00720 [Hymenobacter sp.]
MHTPYSGHGKGQLFTPEVGSQVLVGYEHELAEFPVVLGSLFHPQNNLKGLQTAGGNKFVMSEVAGAQTILLSNSNKKGTSMTIGFADDGSVHIQSEGPVTVNGSVITLGAGVPGKGQTAYTGQIIMRAKTITMAAEEEVKIDSIGTSISLQAKQHILADATEKMELTAETASLTGRKSAGVLSPDTVDVGQGTTVNVSAAIINQS